MVNKMTYRNTCALINVNNIEDNIRTIIKKYSGYKYYFGVVKADFYGHSRKEIIDAMVYAGINYFAVSSLDEALEIRQCSDMPILCLGYIDYRFLDVCRDNHIDIMVDDYEYLTHVISGVNIHLKVDTGMNRLGIKDNEEFLKIYNYIKENNLILKGIFTHIYNASNEYDTDNQIEKFKSITSGIDLNSIDIVHIAQSDTLVSHDKIEFCNGCRLGIIMYGLVDCELNLKSTFKLVSEVVELKKIKTGEIVSYGGKYVAQRDETIAIVSIGYADGVNRHMSGGYVFINDKKFDIVGSICMDMMMVVVDSTVKLHDKVYVYKDINHIKYLSEYLDTIPYELLCNVSKRVPRIIENK